MTRQYNAFQGSKVRLTAPCPEDSVQIAHFTQNYEYMRNLDTDIVTPQTSDETGSSSVRNGQDFEFALRTLEDNRFLGFVAIYRLEWNNRSAQLAIGIGEERDRGKGYGSDALALILRYAFHELNLNRIALDVIEYNEAARRAYLKAGFREEGRHRAAVLRDGTQYDLISMSILAADWSAQTGYPVSFQPGSSSGSASAFPSAGSTTVGSMAVQATPRIGVGAVILNERNEVLLVWRNRAPEQHTWSIPGGKVDVYETLETAVIREVKEEVNLDIVINGLLCTAETIRPERQEHWISVLYSTKVVSGEARNLEEGGAIGEIGWFPLHELPSPLASFAVPALEAAKQQYTQKHGIDISQ
ncbi:ADP-ribose pyrophosphatase YjhB, NUDIX family [Paenibacillus polysaccharolyticus]|uniref:ADP-ribose pyrophosphatase YjhB, NUDIX family n=2 Tax=Paenibacillus polysaccharolyticus TaxID=582692 RepID=A0A1G5FYP9_9BACL|nr:ADP-ribose pyrophosphatase YjhB, NUDIX family [Paenibacillus polysaccharolyticus]